MALTNGNHEIPPRIIATHHMADLADYAGRQVLRAWENAQTAGDDHGGQLELEAAMKLLADLLVLDIPEEYDPRPYIAANEWVFARTMPTNPHYYVVLPRSTDWREHLRFLRWIRVWGHTEMFKGYPYLYRVVDDNKYWALGLNETILNRKQKDQDGQVAP